MLYVIKPKFVSKWNSFLVSELIDKKTNPGHRTRSFSDVTCYHFPSQPLQPA